MGKSFERKIKEEVKRHKDFMVTFSLLLLILLFFFWFFTKDFYLLIFSFLAYVISSFIPDALFILLGIITNKSFSLWREKVHKFSASLLYFLILLFFASFFFQFPKNILIAFSGLIGYWVHLFVDKLEELELFLKSLLSRLK